MLDYLALGILLFASTTVFYGIIAIHDIPYEIAVHRNHPHQDAIHYAGWISLFTIGAIWPFLWIWATLYREDRGWGMIGDSSSPDDGGLLITRLAALEERLERLEQSDKVPATKSDTTEDAGGETSGESDEETSGKTDEETSGKTDGENE